VCIRLGRDRPTTDGGTIWKREILSIFMTADRYGSRPRSMKEKSKKIQREQALTSYYSGKINRSGSTWETPEFNKPACSAHKKMCRDRSLKATSMTTMISFWTLRWKAWE
jgi:hypothetical protein